MEERGEDPRRDADLGKQDIIWSEGVSVRDGGADSVVQAVPVGVEVSERAEDGEGLLGAEETMEGPFSMELGYGQRGRGEQSVGGHDVLAGVVAFLRARPEKETVVEG